MIESTPTKATYPALCLHIDGEWLGVDDRRTHQVLNPATGEPLAEARAETHAAAGLFDFYAGERIDSQGFFFAPTVLADVPVTSRAMNEEPFGPVILAAPFKTFDEAVEQANRIADAIESGMVGINTARVGASDAPFQGVKQSGHGSEDGREGVEACLVTKTVHIC